MVVASLAEVMSLGAMLPFLGVLTSPEKFLSHALVQPVAHLLGIHSPQELLLPFTLIFAAAAIFAGMARIAVLWWQSRFSAAVTIDLSSQVYERTLYQPYALQASRNSSEILAGMQKAEELAQNILQPVLTLMSSVLILLALVITLLAIQPIIALAAFVAFGLIYSAVVAVTRRRIADNSKAIAVQRGKATKAIQEGLGGIRDVIIDGTQPVYLKSFKNALIPMKMAMSSNLVVGASPRFLVEALGMVLIAGSAFAMASSTAPAESVTNAIPVLGALALGAQRLLPLMQQIYSAYIALSGSKSSVKDALDLLDQQMPQHAYLQPVNICNFQIGISLKDVGFRYSPNSPWIFRHLNLDIPKGGRVGFVGTTGCGKSTLLDVIMGLLTPTEGALFIDGNCITPANIRAWQSHIAHVPQVIYLSDASIAENVAFGVPFELIDLSRVRRAADQAQILGTIESWREGFNTVVGERGVRLSGGQRQRIGIARAIYKRASVIIFDEATSALDSETESAVMESLDTLDRNITIMMIAHRLSTLKSCHQIFEFTDGHVKAIQKT